jgi:hypothetical protein
MSRGLLFPYKQIDGRFRPIIPIELEHTKVFGYEVLVDSGADICIFHADIGRAIGLVIEKGRRFELGGVTGAKRTGYLHKVTLRVKNTAYQTQVGFTDSMRDGAFGMVGQKGFFDRFAIKFDYAERKIILHKKKWA